MSQIRKMWKLLLQKEFYDEHKHKLPIHSFDEIGQDLLPTLAYAHNRITGNVTEEELLLLHLSLNPVMTTANKNTYEAYLHNVKTEDQVDASIGKVVFANLWRSEVGRVVSQYGINLADGKYTDLDELTTYLTKVGADFIPQDFNCPVDTAPIALFERLNQRGKWHFNIPTLSNRIKYVSPGQFIVILARPESGKTATIINIMAGKEGFAAQGARVHLLANEEGADITAGRAICCFNQKSFHEARENPKIVCTEEWEQVRKNLTFLHQPEINLGQLDQYVKNNRPDVLIIDQLDHVAVMGAYEKGHERLGAIYRRTREIASKYDCVIVGVSQASAEAEDRAKVTFAMAEGSKTAKAAAADLILGIGKVDDNSNEEGNEVLRHFTVSKNKISGWKGTIICKLIQDQSRLIA